MAKAPNKKAESSSSKLKTQDSPLKATKEPETEKMEDRSRKTGDAEPSTLDSVLDLSPAQSPELKATAKAGKRSPKALKETEEKQTKEARKAKSNEPEKAEDTELKAQNSKLKAHKPSRPKHERAGKKYREVYKLVDKTKEYGLKEALELALKTNPTKFDATVELHVRLNVDPKVADQNIRDSLVLPAGTGKNVRVAVFGEADSVAEAKKAGADIAGSDEFLQQLDKGKIDFDVLIATPTVMAKLGKYARVLGPKGLMPNPKSGTVTKNVTKAVKEAKGGRVEYRVDSTGIVHVAAGKVSFGTAKLEDNLRTIFASLKQAKPASVKSGYVKSVFLTTAMGPSIKVSSSELN